jgi:hypothetical protein
MQRMALGHRQVQHRHQHGGQQQQASMTCPPVVARAKESRRPCFDSALRRPAALREQARAGASG